MIKKLLYLIPILLLLAMSPGGGGADHGDFPNIYIDGATGGVGSEADPLTALADINWTTGGDNSVFDAVAGDEDVTINLKKTVTWRELMTVGTSGSAAHPITIQAYGSGADPIINGSDIVETWSEYSSWQTTWTQVVVNYFGTVGIRNYRNILDANAGSVDGTKIRITVEAGIGGAWTFDGCSIGVMTTDDVYDVTPTRVTWTDDGGGDGATVEEGTTAVSDEVTFDFDKTKRHGIHYYMASRQYVRFSSTGMGMYYDAAGDDTMVQDASLAPIADQNYCTTKIEVYSGAANVWKATLTTEPNQVFFDDTRGTNQASAGACDAEFDWFWDSEVLYIYYEEDPDGAVVIEATQRNFAIYSWNKSYYTVDGLNCTKSDGHVIAVEEAETGVTITNSEVSWGFYYGIFINATVGAGGKNYITNNSSHDNLSYGIVAHDKYSGSGTESYISNNTSYDNYGGGISVRGNYHIIENNTVYDNGHNDEVGKEYVGIFIYSPASDAGDGDHNIIRYNIVYNQISAGFEGSGFEADRWCDYNEFYYNIAYNNDAAGFTNYGNNHNKYYNNVSYGNNQDSSGELVAARGEIRITGNGDETSNDIECKNNIAVATEANTYAIYVDEYVYDQTLDITNNIYLASASDWYFWNASGGDTLATWNALTGVGTDLNSDPLMTDPGSDDFTLQKTSPCIDAGIAVGLKSDYRGTLVPKGSAPDIGAYEYFKAIIMGMINPLIKALDNG